MFVKPANINKKNVNILIDLRLFVSEIQQNIKNRLMKIC